MTWQIAPIYMIRAGEFGAKLAPRLLFSFFAFGPVAWDLVRNRRLDYLWIFLTGLLIWTAAEAILQTGAVRTMVPQSLYGFPISPAAAILIQGAAEGASVAILGIFIADRLLKKGGARWSRNTNGAANCSHHFPWHEPHCCTALNGG